MKPAIEFLKELPDGYRQLALEVVEKWPDQPNRNVPSMDKALCSAFYFSIAYPGKAFWWGIINHYTLNAPLPPLPAEFYWKWLALAAQEVIDLYQQDFMAVHSQLEDALKKYEELKNQKL